jgi:hypothetical protein
MRAVDRAGYSRIGRLALMLLATVVAQARGQELTPQVAESPVPFGPFYCCQSWADAGRVLVLDPENDSGVHGLEKALLPMIRRELADCGKISTTIIGDNTGFRCDSGLIIRGDYPITLLVRALREYRADAVLFSNISAYRPWPPMEITLTIFAVDTRDARLLASSTRTWSLADGTLAERYLAWARGQTGVVQCPGDDLLLSSPTRFHAFVIELALAELSQPTDGRTLTGGGTLPPQR